MSVLFLVAAILLQEPADPLKDFERELDALLAACAAREEKFNLGAAAEGLDLARSASSGADVKTALAIRAGAAERLSKAITDLENKTSELRRLQNQLERGRKKAAAADNDAKRSAALRYGLDRAALVASASVGEATDLFNLGLDCAKTGAWEEAEDALAESESRLAALKASTWEATAEGPRLASIMLARAKAAQGRIHDAADDLRRGLERNPGWLDREIDFREMLHATPEVHAKFVKSLEAQGDDVDVLVLLGHERYFSGQKPKAKELFQRVLRKRPTDPAAKAFLKKLADD